MSLRTEESFTGQIIIVLFFGRAFEKAFIHLQHGLKLILAISRVPLQSELVHHFSDRLIVVKAQL
ncbi:MAG: hypothetical protein AAFY71_22740 [Bacteroidota bacterium]